MSTRQKALIGIAAATLVVAIGAVIYQAYRVSQVREEIRSLQRQQSSLIGQTEKLQRERDDVC